MATVGMTVLEEQGREVKYVFIHFLDSIPSRTSSEVGVSDGREYFCFEIAWTSMSLYNQQKSTDKVEMKFEQALATERFIYCYVSLI